MAQRVEFTEPMAFAGQPGVLHASCGERDDYLELALEDGAGIRESIADGLARLTADVDQHGLDVQVRAGPPTIVSVLALYIGDPDQRVLLPLQRIACILRSLQSAMPGLAFGDLLPHQPPAEHQLRPAQEPVAPPLGADAPKCSSPRQPRSASQSDVESAPHGTPRTAEGAQVDHSPRTAMSIAALMAKCRALAARGQFHKALRAVEEILRQAPADQEACELRESLRLLERREKRRWREPRNAQAQLEVGFSYLSLGCDNEAISALRHSSRMRPDLYLAHLLLGIAYHHSGQHTDARLAYERAASLRPAEKITSDLLAALNRGEPPPPLAEGGPLGSQAMGTGSRAMAPTASR